MDQENLVEEVLVDIEHLLIVKHQAAVVHLKQLYNFQVEQCIQSQ